MHTVDLFVDFLLPISTAKRGFDFEVAMKWSIKSIELYLNSEFYVKHPSFVKVLNSHSGVFNNVDTLFALSVWHGPLDSGKSKMELVKEEALNICGIFAVHLNGQAIYVCLLYLQFACALFIAVIKVMMSC